MVSTTAVSGSVVSDSSVDEDDDECEAEQRNNNE